MSATKQLASDLREQLEAAGKERWGAEDTYVYVDDHDIDDEWAVFRISPDDGERRYVQVDYTRDVDGTVTLGTDETEVDRTTAYAPKSIELGGPIVRKDAPQRKVWGAVLVPGEEDADGEVLTAEKIEEVAHDWLEDYRAIDRQHSVKQIDASPIESYLEPADRDVEIAGETVTLPEGTWTMAAKVNDDTTWAEIDAGVRTGFSVMGVPRKKLEDAMASVKSGDTTTLKRVTLADVGGGDPNGDWAAPFVSIVDAPAVPKAKFFAMKAAGGGGDDPAAGGLLGRLAALLSGDSAGKEGRRFSTSTYKQLKSAAEAINALLAEAEKERESGAGKAHGHEEDDMDREEIQEIVDESTSEAVKSALALEDGESLTDKIKSLVTETVTTAVSDALSGSGDGGGDTGDGDEDDEVALKEQIEELTEQVEALTAAKSRQINDDDEPANKSRTPERDMFGRRVRA